MVELLSLLRWIHMYAGIAWWGEVFFITFILLPTLAKLPRDSKGPLMLRIFPRIFNVATITASLTVASGATLALFYSNFDVSVFVDTPWGLTILFGGIMGLFMFVLHATVEVIEMRDLRDVRPAEASAFPAALITLERRVKLLPRVGFVVLTAAILLMTYASHGL